MKSGHTTIPRRPELAGWPSLLQVSAREVFRMMLGSELEAHQEELGPPPSGCTAMVGLTGQVCGMVSLRCTTSSAELMASRMLGISPADVGEQVWDAVGEVSNMIAGNFTHKISETGERCMLSAPTVITGAHFRMHSLGSAPPVEVRLTFCGQIISVTLEIHS